MPLSTTHTLSTAIMGVGVVNGVRAVNWRVARDVMVAWLLTFPICSAIAWGSAMLIRQLPAAIQLGLVTSGAAITAGMVLRNRLMHDGRGDERGAPASVGR